MCSMKCHNLTSTTRIFFSLQVLKMSAAKSHFTAFDLSDHHHLSSITSQIPTCANTSEDPILATTKTDQNLNHRPEQSATADNSNHAPTPSNSTPNHPLISPPSLSHIATILPNLPHGPTQLELWIHEIQRHEYIAYLLTPASPCSSQLVLP